MLAPSRSLEQPGVQSTIALSKATLFPRVSVECRQTEAVTTQGSVNKPKHRLCRAECQQTKAATTPSGVRIRVSVSLPRAVPPSFPISRVTRMLGITATSAKPRRSHLSCMTHHNHNTAVGDLD
ncbi:hypothetical protein NDU88_003676 [Pleurodeles waltl]|uniref:Uncharacterized protein n=1 Tax=Pleurodeles waltl TaxID=8319 RepID=A0AAV7V335_PLEWA|nr:hypothetical protein NDU88_003676 [Pleurodeles waltl]